ncbi:hypothetical protein VNO77_02445 [Canavalia gladiata]|uniref:Uncharacterized protein n=1 Tax=Canavalia gladiata TaxID=3824 RepID=A0AAN9MTT5_CANGL
MFAGLSSLQMMRSLLQGARILKASCDRLGNVGSHASSQGASTDQERDRRTLRPRTEHVQARSLHISITSGP